MKSFFILFSLTLTPCASFAGQCLAPDKYRALQHWQTSKADSNAHRYTSPESDRHIVAEPIAPRPFSSIVPAQTKEALSESPRANSEPIETTNTATASHAQPKVVFPEPAFVPQRETAQPSLTRYEKPQIEATTSLYDEPTPQIEKPLQIARLDLTVSRVQTSTPEVPKAKPEQKAPIQRERAKAPEPIARARAPVLIERTKVPDSLDQTDDKGGWHPKQRPNSLSSALNTVMRSIDPATKSSRTNLISENENAVN